MSVNNINNGDSASGIREKLNEIIAIANHYSSSFITGSSDGGAGGGAGGGGADSISVYSSGIATLNPESTSADACGAISTGYPYDAYIQKDASNMGGTCVPEVNDFLYSDSDATTALDNGWYGWYDTTNLQNKSIEVTSGSISTINTCA